MEWGGDLVFRPTKSAVCVKSSRVVKRVSDFKP